MFVGKNGEGNIMELLDRFKLDGRWENVFLLQSNFVVERRRVLIVGNRALCKYRRKDGFVRWTICKVGHQMFFVDDLEKMKDIVWAMTWRKCNKSYGLLLVNIRESIMANGEWWFEYMKDYN